ncbi:UNVERIFIED_CONTAM: hypothetical protein HDU68_011999, partial [Siphonaria sp. JEL0065]
MTISTKEGLAAALKTASIKSTTQSHAAADSLAGWASSLTDTVPTKTLVLKPKGLAGTDLIIVVAKATAEFGINPLVKLL